MVSQDDTIREQKKAALPTFKVGLFLCLLWLFVFVGTSSACIIYGVNQIKDAIENSSVNTVGQCLLLDYEEEDCLYRCMDFGGEKRCIGTTYLYTAIMESKCGDRVIQGYDERCEGSQFGRSDLVPPEVKDLLEEHTCYLYRSDCDQQFTFVHEGQNYFSGLPEIIAGIIGILACPCLCGCCWIRYWRQKEFEYEEAKSSERTTTFEGYDID